MAFQTHSSFWRIEIDKTLIIYLQYDHYAFIYDDENALLFKAVW